MDDFFQPLANTRPFLKLALEGFPGSGKTFTASQIAVGLHKYIGSTKPIVVYDTERAFKALEDYFMECNVSVITRPSRSLADLVTTMDRCEKGASEILIIDSITHVWEAFIESYKAEKKKTFLQLLDWGILKPKWKKLFSDKLVLSNFHIIFAGRAGYEYDNELNEDTQKRELIKSRIKMKVESDTPYEPDILVLMERHEEFKEKELIVERSATILKDRSRKIDGKIFYQPTFDDFEPAVTSLLKGVAKDIQIKETVDSFKEDDQYDERKKVRQISLEEIEGILVQLFPGQSAVEKKFKMDILEKTFNTRSWKAIEILPLDKLTHNVSKLKSFKDKAIPYIAQCREDGINCEESTLMGFLDE